jgi:hypothetical protein
MGTISLTLPVSGTVIAAGLHATNYAAIQTAINGGIEAVNIADGSITQAKMAIGNKTTRRDIDDGPPSSPTDGDIWIAEDVDGENSGNAWMFVYNGDSSSAYKWEFVGGTAITKSVDTNQTPGHTVNTWGNLATAGPLFAPPRSGDYIVRASAYVESTDATPKSGLIGVVYGDGNPAAPISKAALHANGYGATLSIASARLNSITVVGSGIQIRYQATDNNLQFSNRTIAIAPVRVS